MSRLLACAALIALQASVFVGLAWAAGKEHTVGQKGKKFSESEIAIQAGDKIVFKNDDEVAHNIYCKTKGAEFNIKSQAPGSSQTVSFDQAGTFEVRCAIHPKMKLTVKVGK